MTRLLHGLLAASLALLPALAGGEDRPVVKSIEVEGNRRVEVDAVKAVLSQKAGQPLDPAKVQKDVRDVMKLGYFSDVVVEARGDPKAPVLVYRVTEKPSVIETKIEGNDEISTDDLKDLIEVKQYAILDLGAVRRTVKKIQEKYVEKGFFLAEVGYRLEERPDNQVVVVFTVNEHAKVQVKQVNIIGNEHVPKDDLTAVMQTQEGGYLSFLTSAGTYKDEAIQRDVQAIQSVYLERGYVNVKVAKPFVQITPDKRYIYVTFQVEEGEQYRIGKVDFSGELLGRRDDLERLLESKPGDLFQRSKVSHDLFAVGDVYRDMGYAYANVTPVTSLDNEKRLLDLTLDVQPGVKTYFEKIEIVGNTRTRDKVIRRELRIYEGDLYSGTGIKVSKQRVNALGYFETVEITTKKGTADDKVMATVEVKEKSTGTFQIGAGYSSYENVILTGQISQQNLFGWGQTLSLSVQWSSLMQLGQIQFVEPYFLDTRWTFAFDLYATEMWYQNFTRQALGGDLTWGYELAGLSWLFPWASKLEDLRVYVTYLNEHVNVTSPLQQLQLYNAFRSGTTSLLRFSIQWDKRDNRIFPTAGVFAMLSADVAPPFMAPTGLFGQQVNLFTRYAVDWRYYQPLFWGLVGRFHLTAGVISAWDAAHPVPISELYYIGGIYSGPRGYQLLGLAPRVLTAARTSPDTELAYTTVGGNKQLILNWEIEFPILEKMGVKGVVFFDMGNAFPPGAWSDPSVSLSLYKSWGFGFRWVSPIGPLRFEWGIPLNRRKDPISGIYLDNAVDFQFTIGNFF